MEVVKSVTEGSAGSVCPLEEWRLNLAKDGGRTVMHCGDPYEDDVERLPEEMAERMG